MQQKARSRLLVVDDDPNFVDALTHALTHAIDISHVRTGADALHHAGLLDWDAILIANSLPDTCGIEVIRRLRFIESRLRPRRILGHFETGCPRTALQMFEAGASGVIGRPAYPDVLLAYIGEPVSVLASCAA